MCPAKRIRNTRILLAAVAFISIWLIGSEVFQAKPQVRFLRFESVVWPGATRTEIMPIFEIRNQTGIQFHYIMERGDGYPDQAVHVIHSEGGASIPEKYYATGEYCTGVPIKVLNPGESREIGCGFFGLGENAFRAGVKMWPAARDRRGDLMGSRYLRNLARLWDMALRRVIPDKDLSWSDWVVLPQELKWFRKNDPISIDPHRVWPTDY